jgi:membrane-associated protease RseP (regulator of RpoE activity)
MSDSSVSSSETLGAKTESAPVSSPAENGAARAPGVSPGERAAASAVIVSAASAAYNDPAVAHLPELRASDLQTPRERRVMLPIVLFVATCVSTFWVGVTRWEPMRPTYTATWEAVRQTIEANWPIGLAYMGAVLAILLTHEMGHFLQTVKYRIAASYPMCIPVPFNPIGTMGAVISMDGSQADRRQIFDIGIAGPLAGLGVAFPVLWQGIKQLDLSRAAAPGDLQFHLPLVAQWMMKWAHPDVSWAGTQWVALHQLNPYFMAGWVGMLITGLNMLPVSQLDGGHTMYALFLDRAHTFARFFISFSILYVVINLDEAVLWTPMLLLVIFLGIHHPPTRDDSVPLGPVRWAIGLASLAIPVLCFPLLGVKQ